MELCGLDRPDSWPKLDGRSLAPLMKNDQAKWPSRTLHTQMHGGNGFRKPGDLWEISTAMTKRWRLVEGRELYDILADPAQRNDVAEEHPDVVQQLTEAHTEWFASVKPGMVPTRILVGADVEEITELTSQEWVMPKGGPPWAHGHVLKRMIANGPWWLDVAEAGKYRISLSRWPAYIDQPIDSTAASIEIAGQNVSMKIDTPDKTVTADFQVELPAGPTELTTTLTTPDGREHGAYFVEIERIASPECSTTETEKPNVLFIISDDLTTALSGMGHPECKTPNLDRFAKSGVMFTRAFCQFPLCGPSRASLMTGQYPLANGVTGNVGVVHPDRITLPRHFANHGYWTGRVSKIYHMAIPADIIEGMPGRDHAASWSETYNIAALETLTPGKAEDFTVSEAVPHFPDHRRKWLQAQAAGEPYRMPAVARGQWAVVEVAQENEQMLADTMATDKAIELLQARAGKTEPFFLAVGLIRPHFPFVSTEDAISQYAAEELTIPEVPSDDYDDLPQQAINSVLKFDKAPLQKLRRGYFGAVSYMDRQVGRLLEELDRLKLRDNTIVVFVSDHGYLMGEHHMWKKSKLWEEAIRVPIIISVPGGKQGVKCDHIVELVDLYPTLAELAGLPRDPKAQGQSLVTLLNDPQASLARNDAFIQVGAGYGLRSGKWAYMWYPASRKQKQEGFMLYDMAQDPHQFTNLADSADYATIRQQLHARLLQRIKAARK